MDCGESAARKEFLRRMVTASPDDKRRWSQLLDRNNKDDRHLKLMLTFFLTEKSNCVDVGAYRGKFIADMLRLAPHGQHIAFEPVPHLSARLKASWPQIDVRSVALGDVDGVESFNFVPEAPGYSGFREQDYPFQVSSRQILVDVARLDSCLPEAYVPNFIKIDVEGAELRVLRGGVEMLSKHRPVIAFEHGRAAARYDCKPEDMYRLIVDQIGMRIFDMDGGGPYSFSSFKASCENDTRWNYIAHDLRRYLNVREW